MISSAVCRLCGPYFAALPPPPDPLADSSAGIPLHADDDDSDGVFGAVSGNAIYDGEVGDEDENGHAQDDDDHEHEHDNVHERPSSHNEPDFVLVEPVQQTDLNQMKT